MFPIDFFIISYPDANILNFIYTQLEQIDHLSAQIITDSLVSASTDELFSIVHETDCFNLLESLFLDLSLHPDYILGSCEQKTPLIDILLTTPVWNNIPFPKCHSFTKTLPFLAQNPLLHKATDLLLTPIEKQTLLYYFENNLNVLQTAQEMYTHRNTLNYRLAHIFTQTGINPRSFYGAMYFFQIIHSPICK